MPFRSFSNRASLSELLEQAEPAQKDIGSQEAKEDFSSTMNDTSDRSRTAKVPSSHSSSNSPEKAIYNKYNLKPRGQSKSSDSSFLNKLREIGKNDSSPADNVQQQENRDDTRKSDKNRDNNVTSMSALLDSLKESMALQEDGDKSASSDDRKPKSSSFSVKFDHEYTRKKSFQYYRSSNINNMNKGNRATSSQSVRDAVRNSGANVKQGIPNSIRGVDPKILDVVRQFAENDLDADDLYNDPISLKDIDKEEEGKSRHENHLDKMEFKKRNYHNKLPPGADIGRDVTKAGKIVMNESISVADFKKAMADRVGTKSGTTSTAKSRTGSSNNAEKVNNKDERSVKSIQISQTGVSIKDLASKLSMKVKQLQQRLNDLGENISNHDEEYLIDVDVAELAALDMGINVTREKSAEEKDAEMLAKVKRDEATDAVPRAPVVCIMGHVDHGKTSLLDKLRSANVAGGEAGGITQRLSAFRVDMSGTKTVFLDTPGHAAFTAMRSNGASATDLVILVVAIDDGVRPQTTEALKIAKEANSAIIVALNKVDKIADAKERENRRGAVVGQLAEHDLITEDLGGDIQIVEVSAISGIGISDLIESIQFQADMLELKAAVDGPAEAVVLDAVMEKGRGVVADVLVQWGALKVGDSVVVGTSHGKIKAITDDRGKTLKVATPSTPVRILGLRSVPTAGEEMIAIENEVKAKAIIERREKVIALRTQLQRNSEQGNMVKDGEQVPISLNVILKADGVGTSEALEKVVKGVDNRSTDVELNVIGNSVGDINSSDVELAINADNVIILGFNIGIADTTTRNQAKQNDIKIVRDSVIYRLEDSLIEKISSLVPLAQSY